VFRQQNKAARHTRFLIWCHPALIERATDENVPDVVGFAGIPCE